MDINWFIDRSTYDNFSIVCCCKDLLFHTTYIFNVKIDPQHAVNKVVSDYYNIKSIKLNPFLKKYRVEEDLDVVHGIKSDFKEKLK